MAVSPARQAGFVVFPNSRTGLAIAPAIAVDVLGGPGPTFTRVNEAPLTPAFASFIRSIRDAGAAQALKG